MLLSGACRRPQGGCSVSLGRVRGMTRGTHKLQASNVHSLKMTLLYWIYTRRSNVSISKKPSTLKYMPLTTHIGCFFFSCVLVILVNDGIVRSYVIVDSVEEPGPKTGDLVIAITGENVPRTCFKRTRILSQPLVLRRNV